MSDKQENKEGKRNGLITTLIFHVCLLVLCFFLGFTYYIPPKGDVAIGFEALGQEDAGKNSELASSEQVNKNPQEIEANPQQNSADEQDFASQETSPVEVTKSKKTKTKKKQEVKKETTQEEVVKPREVDENLKDLGQLLQGPDKSGGAGDGGKSGNQGSENGVPSGDGNGGKGGNGKNGMFDLDGRKAIKPGNLTHNCGVQGTIRVRVQVDRAGNVIGAKVESGAGTTSMDGCLRQKAELAAKATKYTPNANGPAVQEGVIFLNFSLN